MRIVSELLMNLMGLIMLFCQVLGYYGSDLDEWKCLLLLSLSSQRQCEACVYCSVVQGHCSECILGKGSRVALVWFLGAINCGFEAFRIDETSFYSSFCVADFLSSTRHFVTHTHTHPHSSRHLLKQEYVVVRLIVLMLLKLVAGCFPCCMCEYMWSNEWAVRATFWYKLTINLSQLEEIAKEHILSWRIKKQCS